MGCRLDEVSLQHDPVVDLPLLAWQDRLLGFVHGGLEWRFTDLNRNPLSHGLPEHGRGRLSRIAGRRESHELEHVQEKQVFFGYSGTGGTPVHRLRNRDRGSLAAQPKVGYSVSPVG